ncbi:MAG: hypothetical protein NVS1B13_11690 [Flavisolibacter sp.]
MIKKLAVCFILFFLDKTVMGQTSGEGELIRFSSKHTSFPDSARARGYHYDSSFFSGAEHYSDSSVTLVVPKNLQRSQRVDLVFWFHGWHNNIDMALEFYKLRKQFIASESNAILVLAETAKNAPDSYGGKLENQGLFKNLVQDVIQELETRNKIASNGLVGNIVLAGHSGAFRVIAFILEKGEVPVQEVFLFDALYAQVDKYMSWLEKNRKNHFIHWFTNKGGGTDEMSVQMMTQLTGSGMNYKLVEEGLVTKEVLKNNSVLFVHSPREHNLIIHNPDNFKLLLENSHALIPIRKHK